jgi:hypothetical protein
MTYSESARDIRIDHARVVQELDNHGVTGQDLDDFWIDCLPDSQGMWNASDVLEWLGY